MGLVLFVGLIIFVCWLTTVLQTKLVCMKCAYCLDVLNLAAVSQR